MEAVLLASTGRCSQEKFQGCCTGVGRTLGWLRLFFHVHMAEGDATLHNQCRAGATCGSGRDSALGLGSPCPMESPLPAPCQGWMELLGGCSILKEVRALPGIDKKMELDRWDLPKGTIPVELTQPCPVRPFGRGRSYRVTLSPGAWRSSLAMLPSTAPLLS